jgi:hypothetical protein
VESVTPAEGAIGVAYEEVVGLVIFFYGSADEGFLQTDESSEYRINSQKKSTNQDHHIPGREHSPDR